MVSTNLPSVIAEEITRLSTLRPEAGSAGNTAFTWHLGPWMLRGHFGSADFLPGESPSLTLIRARWDPKKQQFDFTKAVERLTTADDDFGKVLNSIFNDVGRARMEKYEAARTFEDEFLR